MNIPFFNFRNAVLLALVCVTGCALPPYDYTQFRQHHPRSIVVLPPLNESTSVKGTYSYYSTVTFPIAEMGYYVFPIAVIDQFLKENGMPGPGEMHQIPPQKFHEILVADAVMYTTLTEYGSKYQLINSRTVVSASAKLIDTRTGTLLWEGDATVEENSGGSGNVLADLFAAAVTQAINSSTDAAHALCPEANELLFTPENYGLLFGPYHPDFGKEKAN